MPLRLLAIALFVLAAPLTAAAVTINYTFGPGSFVHDGDFNELETVEGFLLLDFGEGTVEDGAVADVLGFSIFGDTFSLSLNAAEPTPQVTVSFVDGELRPGGEIPVIATLGEDEQVGAVFFEAIRHSVDFNLISEDSIAIWAALMDDKGDPFFEVFAGVDLKGEGALVPEPVPLALMGAALAALAFVRRRA